MLALENTIVDDTVKPAIEWINGRPVQKLRPTDLHGILQLAFAKVLEAEISSPGDDASEVESRREFFLWWGVKLVLIADPEQRTLEYHESEEYFGKLNAADTFDSLAFPSLSIPLQPIFAEMDEPA